MRIRLLKSMLFVLAGLLTAQRAAAQTAAPLVWVEGGDLKVGIDPKTGLPARIESRAGQGSVQWLNAPPSFAVRNEVTNTTARLSSARVEAGQQQASAQGELGLLALRVSERWRSAPRGVAWDCEFSGNGTRAGHEVVLELPVLTVESQIFTPSNRGVIEVAACPTYKPPKYAHFGMFDGLSYVLPLVSVLNSKNDSALTVALPPDANIPHLQVEWKGAKTLRLTLGHRGMGGGRPSSLRLLLYSHPADYRAAIRAYSDDFPKYFRPTMPRDGPEGAFY